MAAMIQREGNAETSTENSQGLPSDNPFTQFYSQLLHQGYSFTTSNNSSSYLLQHSFMERRKHARGLCSHWYLPKGDVQQFN
jgi:hypothetical protein